MQKCPVFANGFQLKKKLHAAQTAAALDPGMQQGCFKINSQKTLPPQKIESKSIKKSNIIGKQLKRIGLCPKSGAALDPGMQHLLRKSINNEKIIQNPIK